VTKSTQWTEASVTRTVADLGQRQVVVVSVSGGVAEPEAVRVTESLPRTRSLSLDGTETVGAAGGTLVVEGVVEPGRELRFGYCLTGASEPALPETVVDTLGSHEQRGLTARWVGPDGDETDLAIATTASGGTESRVPMVSVRREQLDTEPTVPEAERLADVALGVVLTPTNEDAAFRTVLRARQRGHRVFVTDTGIERDAEALSTLSSLGATVVEPGTETTQAQLHRVLSRTAREHGLAGIILQTRDCPRIDYGATAAAVGQAEYEIVAIPERRDQTASGPALVVGIPAYNAADSIADVVARALPVAEEVVVVDDGSRDDTADRARAAGATVVTHERNRGYGGALKTLFRTAADRDTEHLVIIDADGQHDPGDIPMLVETQRRDQADIVIGSRYVGERQSEIPFVRSVGLAVINWLTNLSMGKLRPSGFVRDTQSGYRAYSRQAIRSLASDPTIGDNMGASTDILYHAHRERFSIAEVETTITYDVANASTQGSVSHGLDLVRNIVWTIEYGRPLLVVFVPGVVAMLLGVLGSVLLVSQSIESGSVAPAALTASMAVTLGGVLLSIAGLMMHVLNSHPTLKRLSLDGNA
jgi:hypothetical protein